MTNADQWLSDLFNVVKNKNITTFADYLAPDIAFQFGNTIELQGKEATLGYVEQLFQNCGVLAHRLDKIITDKDLIICHGHAIYTAKDQSTLVLPFSSWLYMQDNKITRYLVFADTQAMAENL